MWLFLTVPWVGLQCVIVVFPDHTHLHFVKLLLRYFDLSTKVQNGINLYSRLIEKLWCVSVKEQMVDF